MLTTGLIGTFSLCMLILTVMLVAMVLGNVFGFTFVKVSHFFFSCVYLWKISVGIYLFYEIGFLEEKLQLYRYTLPFLNSAMFLASPEYKTLSCTRNINARHKYFIFFDPKFQPYITVYNINSSISMDFFKNTSTLYYL